MGYRAAPAARRKGEWSSFPVGVCENEGHSDLAEPHTVSPHPRALKLTNDLQMVRRFH